MGSLAKSSFSFLINLRASQTISFNQQFTMPPQNSVLVTPIQKNKSLLNSLFKFKPTSKLLRYVQDKSHVKKTVFTLAEVLTVLKNVIRGEGQFDEKNPAIIMCSAELEKAINMKALHVMEIRDLVLSHLIKIQDEEFLQNYAASQGGTSNVVNMTAVNPVQRIKHSAMISTQVVADKKAKFTLKPKFLKVIRSVPGVSQDKTVFTYEEITYLLSIYIFSNRKKFFDDRNTKLAIVKDDPLGEAFNVDALHRCQVIALLRGQILPVVQPGYVDTTSVAPRNARPGPVPAFPALSNTQTSSARPGPMPAFPALTKPVVSQSGEWLGKPAKRKSLDIQGGGKRHSLDSGVVDADKLPSTPLLCIICMEKVADTALVHGQKGHTGFCNPCAERLWTEHPECPLCRERIENIIKVY